MKIAVKYKIDLKAVGTFDVCIKDSFVMRSISVQIILFVFIFIFLSEDRAYNCRQGQTKGYFRSTKFKLINDHWTIVDSQQLLIDIIRSSVL